VLFIVLLTAVCVVGMPYYTLPMAARVRSPSHPWLKPAGYIGQSAGLLAVAIFIFLWLYPLRKKFRWLAFTGTIGLGRAFDRERENDTMRALLLSPVPRLAVFLGKAISMAVLILAVAVISTPLLALWLNAPLFEFPGELALAIVLGAIGIAVVGSVFAATLLKVRSRDVLLPVILYPLLVPLFVAGTKTTAALVEVHPNLEAAWYWIGFLGIFDAAFLVLSLWIFESLVIE